VGGVLHKRLSEWSIEDLDALVAERVEETQRLEYKRELPLVSKSERAEAAKDASGMANAQGGLLLYGVDEEKQPDGRRLPTRLRPIADGGIRDQLHDVLYSAVSPTLNLDSRLIDHPEGGYVLAVRVHQRSGPPHMVTAYGENRYYVRRETTVLRMTAHEVEQAFAQVAHTEERLGRLLRRLPIRPPLTDLTDGNMAATPAPPSDEGWVGYVAAAIDPPGAVVKMSTAERTAINQLTLRLLETGSLTPDQDGYVTDYLSREQSGLLRSRIAIYRTGVIEWGDATGWAFSGENRGNVASEGVLVNLHRLLQLTAMVFERAGYYGRVRVWFTLDHAELTQLATRFNPPPQLATPRGRLEHAADTNVETLLADTLPILRILMDYLWQAYGWERCHLFTEEGELNLRN
jgi:Putative DNA-binding domain